MINLELLRRNKGTIFILEKYLVLYNQGRRCQREEDTNAPVTDKYIYTEFMYFFSIINLDSELCINYMGHYQIY